MGIDKVAKVATLHRLGQPKWAEELSHRWVACLLPCFTAYCCLLIAGWVKAATLQTALLSAAPLPAMDPS